MFTGSWKHLWTSKLPIPILLPNSNKFLLEASKNIEIYIYTYITQCISKIIGILEDWNWKELETSNSNKKSLEASKNITAYPLSRIDDMLNSFQSAKWFTTLDLAS